MYHLFCISYHLFAGRTTPDCESKRMVPPGELTYQHHKPHNSVVSRDCVYLHMVTAGGGGNCTVCMFDKFRGANSHGLAAHKSCHTML